MRYLTLNSVTAPLASPQGPVPTADHGCANPGSASLRAVIVPTPVTLSAGNPPPGQTASGRLDCSSKSHGGVPPSVAIRWRAERAVRCGELSSQMVSSGPAGTQPRPVSRTLSRIRLPLWCQFLLGGWLALVGSTPPLVPGGGIARAQDGLAAAAALEQSLMDAIAKAEPAVVAITRERPSNRGPAVEGLWFPRRRFGFDRERETPVPADPRYAPNQYGAGVLIDETGLVLTNLHTIDGGEVGPAPAAGDAGFKIYVRLSDRRVFQAEVVAADPRVDLAVLRLPKDSYPHLKVTAGPVPRKGQIVLALGNPYAIARDGSASASWGIVGNITRRVPLERELGMAERMQKEVMSNLGLLMQVDTRLELGTSGGALLNLKGELVGLTSSLAAGTAYEKSAGFAIPFDADMRRVIDQLRQGHEVDYGFLGITPDDVEMVNSPEYEPLFRQFGQWGAVRINEDPKEGFPAAGRLSRGDLVFRINGQPVASRSDLMRVVGLAGPMTLVQIQGYRDNSRFETEVQLGKWPLLDEDRVVTTRPNWEPWRGIEVDYCSGRMRWFSRLTQHPRLLRSVVIKKLAPDSPAARAGLNEQDHILAIGGKPVQNPRDFVKATGQGAGTVDVTVWSEIGGDQRERIVKIPAR